jgi:uncharacterized Tic20 family protein
MGSKKPELMQKKQMPLQIEIVSLATAAFILITIGLFIFGQVGDKFYLLGFQLSGLAAVLTTLLLEVILPLFLLIAIWKRYPLAWKYGAGYFGFFILNEIAIVLSNLNYLSFNLLVLLTILLPFILNLSFVAIFIKQRDYFEN